MYFLENTTAETANGEAVTIDANGGEANGGETNGGRANGEEVKKKKKKKKKKAGTADQEDFLHPGSNPTGTQLRMKVQYCNYRDCNF